MMENCISYISTISLCFSRIILAIYSCIDIYYVSTYILHIPSLGVIHFQICYQQECIDSPTGEIMQIHLVRTKWSCIQSFVHPVSPVYSVPHQISIHFILCVAGDGEGYKRNIKYRACFSEVYRLYKNTSHIHVKQCVMIRCGMYLRPKLAIKRDIGTLVGWEGLDNKEVLRITHLTLSAYRWPDLRTVLSLGRRNL